VNTIFEVIRAHGLRTAWSDKHPAYDLVNGPSGKGVDDRFTPEVDSNDAVTGQDTTLGFHSVQRNDMLKVQSILNEIAGFDSTGVKKVGVPAIFGMNFQAVSVGQKLAVGNANDVADKGLIGGYADAAGAVPNNGLQSGLDFVDAQIGAMISALQVARPSASSRPSTASRRSTARFTSPLMTAPMATRRESGSSPPTTSGWCGSLPVGRRRTMRPRETT